MGENPNLIKWLFAVFYNNTVDTVYKNNGRHENNTLL